MAGPRTWAEPLGHGKGRSLEELLGAAHAAGYTMSLSLELTEANLKAVWLNTLAHVTLEQVASGHAIQAMHLKVIGIVPGADQALFHALAMKAKARCPVSRTLEVTTTLESVLLI